MSQSTDNLLLELASENKKLDAMHARLMAAQYSDGCVCVVGKPCGWHAGIANQIREARRLLHEAGRALVMERNR